MEIQKKEFGKSIRGYNKEEVDEFLDRLLQSYERIYKENRDLKEQIELLEEKMQGYKDIEATLKNTLVLAEKTAEDVRINAQKEREAVLKQAYLQAEKILQRAEQKCNQLNDKNEELRRQFYLYKIRFKNFLQSQLEYLESPELKVFEKNDPVLIDTVLEVASTEDEENEKTLNDSDRTVEINHIDEASGLKEDKM
ncbi:MAG: DivIVA domain-containing protein [Tepidanaerobacteraceae bacterium]